jgi:transcriptional regulator with XRE-family HTH domain
MRILHAFALKSNEYCLYMEKIGMRLKEERVRLGMNGADFGAIGGVRGLAQYRYEKGDRKPDSVYLAQISEKGVDVQYVVTGKRSESVLSDEESILLAHFRALDERGQGGILGLIASIRPEPKVTNNVTTVNDPVDGLHMNGATFHDQVYLTLPKSGGKKSR